MAKEKLDTINYNGVDYPYREITIFKKENPRDILVSTEELANEIYKNGDEDSDVDNTFAGYVPTDVLHGRKSDLVKYVERELYQNEP